MRLRPQHKRDDAGVTLVELLVSTMILGIVGAVATGALISTYKSVDKVDEEGRGLADMRFLTERLSEDLRSSRGVLKSQVPAAFQASNSQLTLWIDYNADYKLQDAETITWKLQANGVHQDVVRSVRNGTSTTVARTLVDNAVFTYDDAANPDATRSVRVAMRYDPLRNRSASERVSTFTVRLRNVQ